MNDDPYSILGVPASATEREIKARFRYLSHAYHPDKFSTDAHKQAAEEDFKRINRAYQILSDPSERSRYDTARSHSKTGPRHDPDPEPQPRAKPQPGQTHEADKAAGASYSSGSRSKTFRPRGGPKRPPPKPKPPPSDRSPPVGSLAPRWYRVDPGFLAGALFLGMPGIVGGVGSILINGFGVKIPAGDEFMLFGIVGGWVFTALLLFIVYRKRA